MVPITLNLENGGSSDKFNLREVGKGFLVKTNKKIEIREPTLYATDAEQYITVPPNDNGEIVRLTTRQRLDWKKVQIVDVDPASGRASVLIRGLDAL